MKYLPSPETFTMSQYSRDCFTITPYGNKEWESIVGKYGIQIPDIVDMTCGQSKCLECKAVYTGYQPTCTKMIVWHKTSADYWPRRGYNGNYRDNFEQSCDGRIVWNLQNQFDAQKEFFSLLSRIGELPDFSYEPLVKFRDHFPEGVLEVLRDRMLVQDVEQIKMDMAMIKSGMSQIANKMNAAGNNLIFGW